MNKNVKNEKSDDFNNFKKHIVDACNEQAQKMQELYTWCQTNYNASTQGIEPFDKIADIKTQLEEFAKNIQNL